MGIKARRGAGTIASGWVSVVDSSCVDSTLHLPQLGHDLDDEAKLFLCNFLLAVTLCMSFERRAFAYADAGTGLLVLQTLSGCVSGCLFFFRKRIKSGLFRKKSKQ